MTANRQLAYYALAVCCAIALACHADGRPALVSAGWAWTCVVWGGLLLILWMERPKGQ